MSDLRVRLAPGGFLPQAFRWEGRAYRVLAVHRVKTCGAERRYRIASSEGYFELALHVPSGAWHVRRHPNWLRRVMYRWQHGARYPLPAWRRRTAPSGRPSPSAPGPVCPARAVNRL